MVALLHGTTIFLGAFAMFWVQPLIGKHLLPWFGGAPAVWLTCMLFFQGALLVGYAYGHWLVGRSRRALWVHLGLLLLTVAVLGVFALRWTSPLTPGPSWRPVDSLHPAPRILLLLALAVGLPCVLLASASPVVQGWYARTGRSPYRLFALSNLGSLLALLAFPVLLEPRLAIPAQGWVWAAWYLLFSAGYAGCAWHARGLPAAPPAATAPPPTRGVLGLWLALATCGSVLLMGATNQLTLRVAVVPMLWVLPLGLYLITFIWCFESDRAYVRHRWVGAMVVAMALNVLMLLNPHHPDLRLHVGTCAVGLLTCCMVCHGELARLKPAPVHLTRYYLTIAAGGALGGLLVAVAAPLIMPVTLEYELAMLACGALTVVVLRREAAATPARPEPRLAFGTVLLVLLIGGWLLRPLLGIPSERLPLYYGSLAAAGVGLMAVLVRRPAGSRLHPLQPAWSVAFCALGLVAFGTVLGFYAHARITGAVHLSRSFYGVLRVREVDAGGHAVRMLEHGRVIHGLQFSDAGRRGDPTSYFGRNSGVGIALAHHPRRRAGKPLRIGGIGLGVGTLAALASPRDVLVFYEIDPDMVALSQGDDPVFGFVKGSQATVEMRIGDARVLLENELHAGQPGRYDVLVVDAFNGGTIPIHLLTREAIATYLAHLRDEDGVLALHVSNRFIDLDPVVLGLAHEQGLRVIAIHNDDDDARGLIRAQWRLLLRDGRHQLPAGGPLDQSPIQRRVWTDAASDLWALFRW